MAAKLEERVREVINSVMMLPPEASDHSFLLKELGADSLDMVEVVSELEEEFNIRISDDDAAKWATLGDVFKTVEQLTA